MAPWASSFTQYNCGLPVRQIERCYFTSTSPEILKAASEVQITEAETFNAMGHPNPRGLHDLKMGAEKHELCETCGQNDFQCPGHMGVIDLPVNVFNPIYFQELLTFLRAICPKCYVFCAPMDIQLVFITRMRLIHNGMFDELYQFNQKILEFSSESERINFMTNDMESVFPKSESEQFFSETSLNDKTIIEMKLEYRKAFVGENMTSKYSLCPHCYTHLNFYKNNNNVQIIIKRRKRVGKRIAQGVSDENINFEALEGADSTSEDSIKETNLTIFRAKEIVDNAWTQNSELLLHLYGMNNEQANPELFFLKLVPVIPPRYRPLSYMNGRVSLHSQTQAYSNLLKVRNNFLALSKMQSDAEAGLVPGEGENTVGATGARRRAANKAKKSDGLSMEARFSNCFVDLQNCVNIICDSSGGFRRGLDTVKGIKQIVEKKEGIFRKNIMGKRVNYAARSVITPDPMIATNEVGMPITFAQKLTLPCAVTEFNIDEMKQLVINGPKVYPGANFIITPEGKKVLIRENDPEQRQDLAKHLLDNPVECPRPSVVERHVVDGDVVILNRQPTLHKPSMQGHLVKVLKNEKTIRLHYSACKAYNADFDGDEINMHLPQSYQARSECYNLMNASHQYLVPKDGSPLGGLIQDHIVGAVHLTLRNSFFTKLELNELIYASMPYYKGAIKIPPPCIQRPVKLWSGKQLFSVVLIHSIPKKYSPNALPNIENSSKVAPKLWISSKPNPENPKPNIEEMDESVVVIKNGELLQGVIDKSNIGAANYSLVHTLYEFYGPQSATFFLSSLSRLMTLYLQRYRGFTVGVKDIVCTGNTECSRNGMINTREGVGIEATAKSFEIDKEDVNALPEALKKIHCERDESKMQYYESVIKGQLGILNNDILKNTLPYGLKTFFPQNNLMMMIESGSKGSSINMGQITCQVGQIELEGRRIPLQISGKHLPCFKPFDIRPEAGGFAHERFMTGLNPVQFFHHCMAGREGLVDTVVKTSRSGYLQRCLIKLLEGVKISYDHSVRDTDGTVVQFLLGEDGLDPIKTSFMSEKGLTRYSSNFSVFEERSHQYLNNLSYTKGVEYWQKFAKKKVPGKTRVAHELGIENGKSTIGDPLMSYHAPWKNFYSVSENHFNHVRKLGSALWPKTVENAPDLRANLTLMANYKYMNSLAQPGDPIGLLTAQSIGEPSTQMTLNTFHFAGRGEVNVTLGIPRLREILQVASKNIKTPTVSAPIIDKQAADKLLLDYKKLYLADVLEHVEVNCEYSTVRDHHMLSENNRIVKVKFIFANRKYCRSISTVTPAKILKFMELIFLKGLNSRLERESSGMKSKTQISSSAAGYDALEEGGTLGRRSRARGQQLEDDEDADSDVERNEEVAGSSAAKQSRAVDDERDYDDEKDQEDIAVESDPEDTHEDGEGQGQAQGEGQDDDPDNNNNADDEEDEKKSSGSKSVAGVSEESYERRKYRVIDLYSRIINYDFDAKKQKHCTATFIFPLYEASFDVVRVIEDECNKAVLYNQHGVNRAAIDKNGVTFTTEGVNMTDFLKQGRVLDLQKLYTNSIWHLKDYLGIEAAYAGIIKELNAVFSVYGIGVDRRYLSLLADYMTRDGTIKAFNRNQMSANPSHIQKMSFESAFKFLKESVLSGYPDPVQSPSACITLGKLTPLGTGSFQLYAKKFKKPPRKIEY